MNPVRSVAWSLIFLGSASVAAQSRFDAPWRAFQAGMPENGRFTLALASADVNGDGRPDAITAQNVFHAGLRVMLNQGSSQGDPATFEDDGLLLPLSRGAWDLVAIDLDLDGDVDLAAPDTNINWVGSTVAVFRNHGDGTFGSSQSFAAGNAPTGITAADLDGDADVDLVVTNYGFLGQGTTISVLRNNGNATFATPVSYSVPPAPARVRAGDLDQDGDVDLVVSHDDTLASVLFNAGNGTFGAPVIHDYASSPGETGLALLDIDGDGDTDAILAGHYDQSVDDGRLALLRNGGSGAFTVQPIPYGARFNDLAVDLVATDLDGDGRDDVVGAQPYEPGFIVFLDDDAGSLRPGAMYASVQNVSGEAGATGVAAADVDLDGDPDVLTAGRLTRLLSVHENLGSGEFPELPIQGRGSSHIVLELGDVDADGDLDAVTSHGGAFTSDIAVYRNDGSGGYTESQRIPGPRGFAKLRELDGDGVLDLLFVTAPSPPLPEPYDFFTAHGNGDGTFGAVVRHPLGLCGIAHPNAFDLDADGDLDVVNTENGACPSIPLSGRRIFISRNNGNGTFQAPLIFLAGAAPYNTTSGDYDEDGHLDLATASMSISAVVFGNGDGTFRQPETFLPSGELSANLLTLDLDVDGNLDLVTLRDYSPSGAAGSESELVILFGDGGGGFTPVSHPSILTQDFREWVSSGDVDGDGDTDILVGGVNDALVFLDEGAGALSFAGRYGIGASAFAMHFAEVTGDGRGDLVALCSHEQPPSGTDYGIVVVPGTTGRGTGTPFCFGDGTSIACPCGNIGLPGRGCDNSSGTGGARLAGSGQAALSADTLVLTVSFERPTALSLFWQGGSRVAARVFGDGVGCLGPPLKRMYFHSAVGGVASAPQGTDPSVSARSAAVGDPIGAGEFRVYHVFYRDPSSTFCPAPAGSTFNVSSGLRVPWGG